MHDNGVTLQKRCYRIWIYRIRMNWQNEWNSIAHIRHWGIARQVLRQNLRPGRC